MFTMRLQTAEAQECPFPTEITIGDVTVDPCDPMRLNIPVFMFNQCPVGGFTFRVFCTDPSWLNFTPSGDTLNWDTAGSCINNWESMGGIVQPNTPGTIRITAIADMPGGDSGIYLPPGNCQILTLHPIFNNYLVCDTSQLLNLGDIQISDTSGYFLHDFISNPDYVYVLPGECADAPRGDANCSGILNGIDVSFLVSYLKGTGPSFCCLCTGDANDSGGVNGIDVTFLVAFFKGVGPAPVPCD